MLKLFTNPSQVGFQQTLPSSGKLNELCWKRRSHKISNLCRAEGLTLDLVVINIDFINCVNNTVFINDVKKYTFIMNHNFEWAGMVGAVGKISVFRPQNPQFDPLLL